MIIAFNIGDSDCDVHNLMQLYGLTHEHSNNEFPRFVGLDTVRVQVSPYSASAEFVSFQKAAFPVVQLVSNEVYMSAEPATLNEPEFIGKNISLSTGNYHPP